MQLRKTLSPAFRCISQCPFFVLLKFILLHARHHIEPCFTEAGLVSSSSVNANEPMSFFFFF